MTLIILIHQAFDCKGAAAVDQLLDEFSFISV